MLLCFLVILLLIFILVLWCTKIREKFGSKVVKLSKHTPPRQTINYYQKIPKIIHQTWKSDKIDKELYDIINHNLDLNPEYEYRFYTDEDMENYIKHNCSPSEYKAYKKINPKYGAARADLFRYLVIYYEGGIYLDIKSKILQPLRLFIKPDYTNLVGWMWNEYVNWWLIYEKKSPLMREVINQVLENINTYDIDKVGVGKPAVLQVTGPRITTEILKKHKDSIHLIPNDKYFNYSGLKGGHDGHLNAHHRTYKKLINNFIPYKLLKEPVIINS